MKWNDNCERILSKMNWLKHFNAKNSEIVKVVTRLYTKTTFFFMSNRKSDRWALSIITKLTENFSEKKPVCHFIHDRYWKIESYIFTFFYLRFCNNYALRFICHLAREYAIASILIQTVAFVITGTNKKSITNFSCPFWTANRFHNLFGREYAIASILIQTVAFIITGTSNSLRDRKIFFK
jgi:hypothetical protein